jgi:hypothetical protein
MLAHYFSLLVLQGQTMGYLISDPSAAAATYLAHPTSAIIAGHVSGLILSHERGLTLFQSPGATIRSQDWMLTIMVGFTCLALWILSAVTTITG